MYVYNYKFSHTEITRLYIATSLQACKVVAICARFLQPCRVITTLHDGCKMIVEIVKQVYVTQGRRNVFTTGPAKLDHKDYAIKWMAGHQLHEY